MKLVHQDFSAPFTCDTFNIIAAEDTATFRNLCEQMRRAADGEESAFVLSDGDKILNMAKTVLFVSDPLSVDFGDKKITTKLLSELSALAEEKFGQDVSALLTDFGTLFDKLNAESPIEIDWSDASPISSVLKAFGVGVRRDYGGFVEGFYNFLIAAIDLLGVKMIAFVNFKSWLTEPERAEVYKLFKYRGVMGVSIESFALPKTSGESVTVIDADLCEISL